jgi:hypothetical protein
MGWTIGDFLHWLFSHFWPWLGLLILVCAARGEHLVNLKSRP